MKEISKYKFCIQKENAKIKSCFFPVSVCAGSAKVSQVKAVSNAPKALIIEPSKELAEQTFNNVKQFKKYVDNPKLR